MEIEIYFVRTFYLCSINLPMTNFSIIPIITLIVVMIIMIILFRYLYNYFRFGSEPLIWIQAVKNGNITKQLLRLRNSYPDKLRFYTWWLQNERLKRDKIPGAFAEVGVYKGDSAVIFHALDSGRDLYLFDTFSGFPASDLDGESGEAATYTTDNFADANSSSLYKKFDNQEKLHIHKGYFPDTTRELEEIEFSLVNLDADLYKPTKSALEFFYPRLSPGGVIFIHDYNYKWPGIIKAVDEFAATIPETMVLMPDSEGTVTIVKNYRKIL
jgi:O-methyltransferase